MGPSEIVDGRTARALRTRGAVVDALLSLLDEGDLKPSGERIADRAGVSLRALWTNFNDMETLYAAAGERLLERQRARFKPIDPAVPLPARIEAFCRQRTQLLEFLAPAARSSQLREPFSDQLRRNRDQQYAMGRKELVALFGTELDAAGAQANVLLDALSVATTWPAWAALRDHFGLSARAARGVMERTVTALLAAPARPPAAG
ncbi:MAG TPA: TetR/AcrR family transcriptional regulator [Mycobacteriales bacterium]|nr:TetR/AcrR family transcriptional regulator [Mycobacteriales bacterium]